MGVTGGFINLPGGTEWLLLVLVFAFLFGPKNASSVIGSIVDGIRELVSAKRDITDAIEGQVSEVIGDAISPEKARKKRRRRQAADEDEPKPPAPGS